MRNIHLSFLFLILFSIGGQTQSFIWTDTISENENQVGFNVVVDHLGNSYSVGSFTGTLTINTLPAPTTITADGGTRDGFLIKYSPTGVPLWVAKIGGTVTPSSEEVLGVDVDPTGNVYICGYLRSAQTIFYGYGNPNITLINSGNLDSFLAKYDSNGNLIWAVKPNGTNADRAYAIKADDTDVYVVGSFAGSLNFLGGVGTNLLTIAGASTDGYIAKYTQNGVIDWVKRVGGSNVQQVTNLDEKDNFVYVGGFSVSASATFQAPTTITLTNTGGDDGFVAKLAKSDGDAEWALKIGSTAADRVNDICAKTNSIWVTGYFTTQLRTFTVGQVMIANTASAGVQDIFLLEYDLNGTLLNTIREGGTGADYGSGVDDDANGDVFMCGVFTGTVNFGGAGNFVSTGLRDSYLAKYNSNGTFNSMNHIRSTSEDSVSKVSIYDYEGSIVGFYNGAPLNITTIVPSAPNPWVNQDDYYIAHFKVCLSPDITNNTISSSQNFCASANPNLITSTPASGGNGVFSYKWQQSPDNINWEDAEGVNNLINYQPPAGHYMKYYRRRVTSSCLPPHYSNVVIMNPNYSWTEWTIPPPVCDDASPLALNTLLHPIVQGSAVSLVNQTGIVSPNNILGNPDGLFADFYDASDELIVDLVDTLPVGRAITITWRQAPGTAGVSGYRVYSSVDNLIYTMNTNGPWLSSIETWFTTTIVLQSPTRYIRILEAGSGFEVDAITYSFQGTSGGTWTGVGVSAGNFDPAIGSSGMYNVTYTLSQPGCVQSTSHQIQVVCCSGPITTCPTNRNEYANNSCQFTIPNYVPFATIIDRCGTGLTITQTPAAGTIVGLGMTPIEIKAVDLNGNRDSCTFQITVLDSIAPQLICPITQNVVPDINCDFLLPDYTGLLTGVFDNCTATGLITYSQSPVAGTVLSGSSTITLTAYDAYSNGRTCQFQVVFIDLTPPNITCPSDVNAANDPGLCSANLILTPAVALDSCGITSLSNSINGTSNASGVYPVGNTNITWIAVDPSGNSSTCVQIISVVDLQAPVLTCPADISTTTNTGVCTANLTISSPVVNENCGVSSLLNTFNGTGSASGIYPIGLTSVTWNVFDLSGLSGSCSFNVFVQDIELPLITCSSNVTVNASPGLCSANVVVPVPVTSDNCGVLSVINSFNSTSNASGIYPVGTTIVNWTVTDINGNIAVCSMNVIVNDLQAPSITCPSNQNLIANASCTAVLGNYIPLISTIDNCTPFASIVKAQSPAAGTIISANTVVTITVTDASGNNNSCNFTVNLIDNTPPSVICPANRNENIDATCKFTIPDYTGLLIASDNCDPSLTIVQSPVVGTVIYDAGTTQTISFIVTDDSGNSSNCSFVVTLVDVQVPVLTCTPNVNIGNNPGLCTANLTLLPPVVVENCGMLSLINSFNLTSNASGIYPVGTTVVNWTGTDINGNVGTCSMSVTVNDIQAPVVNCILSQNVNASPACNYVLPNYLPLITTSDNCTPTASLIVTQNPVAGTVITANTLVTITSTDASGNVSSCSFTVNLIDVTPPSVTCPPNTSSFVDASCNFVIPNYIPLLTLSDNCTPTASLSVTQNPLFGTVISGGGTTQTISFVVTDASGNSSNCSFNLSLIDNINPVPTCGAAVNAVTNPGSCFATLVLPSPTVVENCGISSLLNSFNGTNNASGNYPTGVTNVVWTVTDLSGNTGSCSTLITVTDNQAPIILCPGIQTVNASPTCNFILADYLSTLSVTDNCTPTASITLTQSPVAGTVISANTSVTITATDAFGNISSCVFMVNMIDVTPPIVSCPGNMNATVNASCQYTIPDYTPLVTISDNCTSVPTILQSPAPGTIISGHGTVQTISFLVTDLAGNNSTCSFNLTITDVTGPAVTCIPNLTFNSDINSCSANVLVPTPIMSDNCALGTFSNNYNGGINASDIYPVGLTVVTWTVFDMAGNSSTCSTNISVIDNQAPIIVCPGTQNVNVNSSCEFVLGNYIPLVTTNDNCTPYASLNIVQIPAAGTIINSNTLITINSTDASGNMSSCSFNVILHDVTPPAVACLPNQNVYVDALCEFTIPDYIASLTVSDNCDASPIILQNPPMGTLLSNHGTVQNINFTITDNSGNVSTCSFQITLLDTISPVMICPATISSCAANVSWGNPVVTNNCGNSITTQIVGMPSGSIFPIGLHNIVYESIDPAGNVSTCSFNVIVNSTINTTFYVPDTICFGADAINLNDSTIITIFETNYFFGTGLVLGNPPMNNILMPDLMPAGNYSVTHVVDNGGCSDSTFLNFVILPQLNSTITTPDTICAAYLNFDLNIWYNPGTLTGGIWYGTNVTGNSWDLTGLSGNYDISYVAVQDACFDTTTHTVFVYPDLDTSFTTPLVCVSQTPIDLSTYVTGEPGGVFFGPGITSPYFDPSITGAGTFFIYYQVGVPGCLEGNTQAITVLGLPYVNAGPDQQVCELVADLSASGATSNGFWTVPSHITLASTTDSIQTISSSQYGVSELIWTIDLLGVCLNSDTVQIEFFETIPADAGPDQVLEFTLNTNLDAVVPVQGSGIWTFSNNNPDIWTPSSENTYVDQLSLGTNTFVWTVTNGPCRASDEMQVIVKDLFIPQAVTPNGDGLNDYLLIYGLANNVIHHLEIFNRWGQLLYVSNNYENDWDGKTASGELLPADTYFYTLTVRNDLTYSGFFVLKR